ncbi:MAG: glycoside hydrolase family 6 protein [Proteobacteria bacterium]|nr:glycoside hydrolase family 6 protein [Pseudomonadota bacterium]
MQFHWSLSTYLFLLGLVSACGRLPDSGSRLAQWLHEQKQMKTLKIMSLPESQGLGQVQSFLTGQSFWVDPNSQAMQDALNLAASQSEEARLVRLIAEQPTALWFGNWNDNVEDAALRSSVAASAEGKTLVAVLYNIPGRDCGSHSAGGTEAGKYRQWVQSWVNGIGPRQALVILEPDALSLQDCLSPALKAERFQLLTDAVAILKSAPHIRVYLDAGHSAWHSASEMVHRLQEAGIDRADGFALNVSNYQTLEASRAYGREIRQSLPGDKRFIVDSSRNGAGPHPNAEWCNPMGRRLGQRPVWNPEDDGLDALLWIKRPGESDGACNGGPAAGQWWRAMALELAQGL